MNALEDRRTTSSSDSLSSPPSVVTTGERQLSPRPATALNHPGKRSHEIFTNGTATGAERRPPHNHENQIHKRRHRGSVAGDSSRPAEGLTQTRPGDAQNGLQELHRIKAQHKALTRSIVGTLSRAALEELMVDAALQDPELLARIIDKNSTNQYREQAPAAHRYEPEQEQINYIRTRLASDVDDEDSDLDINNDSKFKFVATPSPVNPNFPSTRGLPWTEAEDQILIDGRARNLTFTEMQHRLPLRTKYGAQKRHKRLVELGRIAEHWDPKTNRYVLDRLDGKMVLQDEPHYQAMPEKDEMTLDDLLSGDEFELTEGNKDHVGDEEEDRMCLDDLLSDSESTAHGEKERTVADGENVDELLIRARTKATEAKELEQSAKGQETRGDQEAANGHQRTKSGWLPVNPPANYETIVVRDRESTERHHSHRPDIEDDVLLNNDRHISPGQDHFDIDSQPDQHSPTEALRCPYEGCDAGPWSYKHKRDEHVKNKHIVNEREKLYCLYPNCEGYGPWTYIHKRSEHVRNKHAGEALPAGIDPNLAAPPKLSAPSRTAKSSSTEAENSSGAMTPSVVVPKTLFCPYDGCDGYGPWTYAHGLKSHIQSKHADELQVEERKPAAVQQFYCDVPNCKSSGPWVQHRSLKNHLKREHGIP